MALPVLVCHRLVSGDLNFIVLSHVTSDTHKRYSGFAVYCLKSILNTMHINTVLVRDTPAYLETLYKKISLDPRMFVRKNMAKTLGMIYIIKHIIHATMFTLINIINVCTRFSDCIFSYLW